MRTDDPTGIARLATASLGVLLVLDLAQAGAYFNLIRVLGGLGDQLLPFALQGAGRILGLSALAFGLVYVVAAIAVLRWVFVCNRNAQAWSPHVEVTPGWNVGWFFVPVASLWRPFQGVRETYQASIDPAEPAGVPVPLVMRLWWAAWIVGTFVGLAVWRIGATDHSPAGVAAQCWRQVALAAVMLVQIAALLAVIRRTTRAQRVRIMRHAFE